MLNSLEKLAHYKKLIDETLNQLISSETDPEGLLYKGARYSLFSGGKRIRPTLTLMTAEAFGVPLDRALLPACGLELIHTYSLIHDDLPCMDDDDFRRGQPTLHKVFNEGYAVLVGDYLLTLAFETIAEAKGIPSEMKLHLISLLAKKAGGDGMIGGQVLDIAAEDRTLTLEELKKIHEMKTGALIATAIEFGAILGGAPIEEQILCRKFGEKIGLAFQIIDDVLDGLQDQNKTSYVSLIGVNGAQNVAETLALEAKEILKLLSCSTEQLESIVDGLTSRKV